MRFNKGDKVKCSRFLYRADSRYIGVIGTFIRYNKYNNNIVYIRFGQSSWEIGCVTESLTLLPQKNQQLLFEFMND